ncbi:CHAT domain-containing protein [Tautonia rosea]|uniref:CHAT domain-containing protein n=1 Tax=Tautonia rosea TaxID=2728037 RepID=UPI0014728550|nr:CHAT domain-containing protein [Tautonia rosea]
MSASNRNGTRPGEGRSGERRPHAIIERFERASIDEVEAILSSPTSEDERALRRYLGDDRFRRMRALAVAQPSSTRGSRSSPRGNVVVLPGLMGSALHAIDRRGNDQEIWLNLWRLARGGIGRLQLASDGVLQADPAFSTRTGNVLWKYYGELVLAMRRDWRVVVFTYDWRKDLRLAADALLASINTHFGPDEPVHLVAHSMGGLVARSFIERHGDRWRSMWSGGEERRSRGGRLVMLGTPNHGSYLVPQVLCGLANTVWMLERLDLSRDMAGMMRVVHSFPGVYQLLPSPLVDANAEPLYDPSTYGSTGVSSRHLAGARAFHEGLARSLEEPEVRQAIEQRLIYVAGKGLETPDGIAPGKLDHLARVPQPKGFDLASHYLFTTEGDGSVSRRLGQLRDREGNVIRVRTFTVQNEHAAMLENPNVLNSVNEVLQFGDLRSRMTRSAGQSVSGLPGAVVEHDWSDPAEAPGLERHADREAARRWSDRHEAQRAAFEVSLNRTRSQRAALRTIEEADGDLESIEPTHESRVLEELILGQVVAATGGPAESQGGSSVANEPPRISIHLAIDEIAAIGSRALRVEGGSDAPPIDAIALGHYTGETPRPGDPAWELDDCVSRCRCPETMSTGEANSGSPALSHAHRFLGPMIERGLAQGAVGQPYFVPDPREPSRVIALCGMGVPGGFGAPELTVLARELLWALGKLGKQHLAAAPIGTKNANLPPAEAAEAWVRGIKLAFGGLDVADNQRVKHLTFVLSDPRIVPEVDRTFRQFQKEFQRTNRLVLDYQPMSEEQLSALEDRAIEFEREEFSRQWAERRQRWRMNGSMGPKGDGEGDDPVRITVRFGPGDMSNRRVFRFGAVTRSAALPMREIDVDPSLVASANDELATEYDPDRQFARGRFLGQLVLPRDFRPLLRTGGPLVMMLDATSARIHWEMVARPELWNQGDAIEDQEPSIRGMLDGSAFLGTSRGLTRQLISGFGAPPEPPPPKRRFLRVLVVADPAVDAPLPGARREGIATVELFRAFNTAWGHSGNIVEVDALIGPEEATRTNVLRLLMGRTYDAFHYAGHAFYEENDPARSGLVFSDGQVISAHEMRRVDRVPRFVFVNACESGVVPSRLEQGVVGYHPGLAPSFAESFFERGVSNFVCTAWPVHDEAATVFSQTLYRGLLGLAEGDEGRIEGSRPQVIHRAMQAARLAVARLAQVPGGALSWGAYQHYGNPEFAFFDGSRMDRGEAAVVAFEPGSAGDSGSKGEPRRGPSRRSRRPPRPEEGLA